MLCARTHGLRRGLRSCAPSEPSIAAFALERGSRRCWCHFVRGLLAALGAIRHLLGVVPQGLKPAIYVTPSGTAEAVPFHGSPLLRNFGERRDVHYLFSAVRGRPILWVVCKGWILVAGCPTVVISLPSTTTAMGGDAASTRAVTF
jgi:hypothetical protein